LPETQEGVSKASLRQRLLQERRLISEAERTQKDLRIAEALLDWCRRHPPSSLGVYWPIRGEPDLRPLFSQLQDLGIALALPVVAGKDMPLKYYGWTPGDGMDTDAYGIAIPQSREVALQPQVLLVPCVGFNTGNYRLGYGGGFYDRTLALTPRPKALGIAYRCGLADFPAEAHDQPLDLVLTEDGEHTVASF
jgi:5,10-methenyltetrahydrofolate synthetase